MEADAGGSGPRGERGYSRENDLKREADRGSRPGGHPTFLETPNAAGDLKGDVTGD